MAILIFIKNSSELYKIAENQEVLDNNKNFSDSEYDLVTVSQEDFNSLRLNKKWVSNRAGNTVTLSDCINSFDVISILQNIISNTVSIMDNYLVSNETKPMASSVITYRNYLKTIDPSALITEIDISVKPNIPAVPLNYSLEEYTENQGIKAISPLELL